MSATVRAPCPQCDRGPRDRALATTTDERGTVSHCHRCGYTEANNIARPNFSARTPAVKPDPQEWSDRAQSIWGRTQRLRGTIGETYLLTRGCIIPPRDSDLRFLSGNDKFPPSLCARVTDILTAKPISLHFTRLAADGKTKAGSDCDKFLLAGHRKKGGCIRLFADDAVSTGLALAEGIESALAAAHLFTPVWSTIDAGNLAAFPILQGIESLTVFADHDDAGIRAARECGRRWRDAGREVQILTPATAGHDPADVFKAKA